MAITSGVEIYDNSKNQPKDLKWILEANSNDVLDLDLNIDKKEMSFINTLAEEDYDTRVQENAVNIQKLYAGGLDATEEQTIRTDFESYLRNKWKLSQYLDGKPVDGVTFSLETSKQTEIKNTINATKFEIQVFRSEVETYFLKQQVQSVTWDGNPSGNPSNNSQNSWGGTNTKDVERNTIDPTKMATASKYMQKKWPNSTVQYTADYYADIDFDEKTDDVDDEDDKKALRKLLKGNDEALDIVDRDYKRSWADKAATRLLTRVLLRIWGSKIGKQALDTEAIISTLTAVMDEYNNGTKFDMDKWWKKKARDYWDKDKYKLWALYQISVENTQGYPYLKRVMGLLVQEFTREDQTIIAADGVTEKAKDFSDIYNEHNDMPTSKQLNLVTKKWQAIRAVETGSFSDRQQIRKLLNLADDVDVAFLLSGDGKDRPETLNFHDWISNNVNTLGRPLTKKESEFVKLCDKNKDNTDFNYVLEWLASGMTIQELANAGKFNVDASGTEIQNETLFVQKFADINFDGKVDFWDKDMIKWLQFQKIYESSAIQMKYDGKAYNQPLLNILSFGKELATKTNNTKYATALEEIIKTPTFAKINTFFNGKENIPLLRFLQKSIMESPLPVADIIQYGTDAYQNFYNNSLELPEVRKKKVDAHLKAQLTAHGYSADDYFDPITKEWVIQAITSFIVTKQSGLGMGTSINIGKLADAGDPALDYFLDGLSINFWVGVSGEDKNGSLWLSLSWDKTRQLSKTTAAYAGVATGVNMSPWFLPMVNLSIGAGTEIQVNRANLEKKLNATSAKKIALGVNVTLINYTIPSRGVNLGYSQEKMAGIEQQYTIVQEKAKGICADSIRALEKDFGDQEKSLVAIENVLISAFGKSTTEALHEAAFNIYRWFQAFNLTKEDFANSGKMAQVATMLGDYYALAWKNAAVTGLKWRHFDNVSVGVQFFADFFPVPTISLQWAKYKNLYYEDTEQSQKLTDKAEALGDGNKVLSNKEIWDKELAVINDTLETSFKNKKSAIKQTEITSNQVADIILGDNNTLKIPFELRTRGILNVNLDPILKWHIKVETISDKDYMVVPSAIPVRFFENDMWTGAAYVLNLWDNKSDGATEIDGKMVSDIMLKPGTSFPVDWSDSRLWNPDTPVFEKTTKIADVNALLKTLNVADYKYFPLLSALKSTEKTKEKQTVFTLTTPVWGKPVYSNLSTTELLLDPTTNKLTLTPETGELIVNYAKDTGTYSFSYKDAPKDALKISYSINNLTAAQADVKNWSTPETIDFSKVDLFDFVTHTPLSQAKTLIEANKKTLKDAEYNHFDQFQDFMKNLWDITAGQNIDSEKLDTAKWALVEILWAKNSLTLFINGLEKSDYKTLAYIMDRMKQIFAMEWYKKTITALRAERGDHYHDINSPSWDKLPPSLDRSLIEKKWKTTEAFDESRAKETNNLIGYTAFYRGAKDVRGWWMTAPGSTTVYSDSDGKEFISDALTWDKLTAGKDWFIGNLQKQTYEKDLLLEAIKSNIPEEYKEFRTQITTDDLISFLDGWEKCVTIDNWTEKGKFKLTLNATYHFYLLWECGNESLGMKIGSIDIQKFTPSTGEISDSYGEVPYGYENTDIGLQVNNAQTRNEAFRGKKSTLGIGFSFGAAKPTPKTKADEPPIIRGSTNADPKTIDFGGTHVQ